jgi:beta-lactam-binding protein with PASTA domain
VIRTDPPAGEEALSGDTVLIVSSLGPAPVTVPDLSGMNESEARSAVETLGLELRVSASSQPVADQSQDGLVVSQIPTAGTTAEQGDTITVTLGEFTPPPTTTTVPPTTTTSSTPPSNS